MKRMRSLGVVLLLALLLTLIGEPGLAQEPEPQLAPVTQAFTYQGQLNQGGSPVNGNCNMQFALFDAVSGGSQVGSTLTRTGVSVSNGLFTVPDLNFGSQHFGEARWLRVAVQCSGDASYITLTPRQALTPPPYAFHWGGTWSGPGTGLTLTGGSTGLLASGSLYGVYASAPAYPIVGVASATTGTTYGVLGTSDSTSGRAVAGSANAASGQTYGVYGFSASLSNFAAGVYGRSTATFGENYGVRGWSDSVQGTGVYGRAASTIGYTYGVQGMANSTHGRGVWGQTTSTTGTTYGVFGSSSSSDGRGVYGYVGSSSGTTYGVYGEAISSNGRGVYGYASHTTGTTRGVYGEAVSPNGIGVYGLGAAVGVRGQAAHMSGYAVIGQNYGTTGDSVGVLGTTASTAGFGVRGHSAINGGTGVYGQASASNANYGVYSFGNTGATGTKAAIVQTQDYGWRHLYAVESPRVLFEDVGTARLVNGRAVVRIDPIFGQTVNLDEPYQVFLTPLGDCGLYVAEKTASSFTVRALDGQTCSVEFDYRIIATRLGYEETRLTVATDPALLALPELGEVQP